MEIGVAAIFVKIQYTKPTTIVQGIKINFAPFDAKVQNSKRIAFAPEEWKLE